MKATQLICPDRRRIEVQEVEVRDPGPGEILVANARTTVSAGTEIWNWVHGAEPGREPRFPHDTGYCAAGTVIAVGEGVTHVRVGDRVACQAPHASHVLVRNLVYRLPDGVSWEDAAFLTMAAIAMHGHRRARFELGEAVVVVGLGLVGQLALSLARLGGALPLIGLDLVPARRDLAASRGADTVLDGADADTVAARVDGLCPGNGADCVIEATGLPAVYPLAVRLARNGGRVVALGSPRGTVEFDFYRDVHMREVDLIGAIQPLTPEAGHVYYPWTKDRDRQLLLQLMARGRLDAGGLITHRARPEQCQAIYEMLADRPAEALGVVFEWS
jgi:2-desacetyl-2-hydroxyethyl bacteriochlorophyllide A dehydrogenase